MEDYGRRSLDQLLDPSVCLGRAMVTLMLRRMQAMD